MLRIRDKLKKRDQQSLRSLAVQLPGEWSLRERARLLGRSPGYVSYWLTKARDADFHSGLQLARGSCVLEGAVVDSELLCACN